MSCSIVPSDISNSEFVQCIGNMQNPGKELMDLVITSDQMSLQCHHAVNSIKVDTSYRGVAITPIMRMKSR